MADRQVPVTPDFDTLFDDKMKRVRENDAAQRLLLAEIKRLHVEIRALRLEVARLKKRA